MCLQICSSQFKQQMIPEGKIAATHVQLHTEQTCCSPQPGHMHTGCPFQDSHTRDVYLCLAEEGRGSSFPDVLRFSVTVFHQEAKVCCVSVADSLGVS